MFHKIKSVPQFKYCCFRLLLVLSFDVSSVQSFLVHPSLSSAFITVAASTTSTTSAATLTTRIQSSVGKQTPETINSNKMASDTLQDDTNMVGSKLSPSFLHEVSSTANSYASANGLQVETVADASRSFQCAPISLLPNAFPRTEFTTAIAIMPLYNILVDRISRNATFLQQTLGGVVSDTDPYTAKLLQLYNTIYHSNEANFAKQADCFGIFRSDYMLSKNSNDDQYHIKQIELNTIAASFAGLSSKVSELHTYLLQRYSKDDHSAMMEFLQKNQNVVRGNIMVDTSSSGDGCGVPGNPTMERIPEAMNAAVERYRSRFLRNEPKTKCIILFVVQPGERNTVDQRMLEFQLYKNHNICVVRKTLTQLYSELQFDPMTGAISLAVDGQQPAEIALVYYRAGYAPTDYPDGYDNGMEWFAREKLERSRATKCPSLGYHLAGTKKVQQALARPGVVEQFLNVQNNDDMALVQQLRQSFAGLYSLDENDITTEDYDAIQHVLSTEHGRSLYVLKPQREGGGYNFYGDQLYQKLMENVKTVPTKDDDTSKLQLNKELGEYILMERLFPPKQDAILLRSGAIEGIGETISELGCYGTLLVSNDGTNVLHNNYAGYLLRTKFSNVDEGGVASGFATLSSPYLC